MQNSDAERERERQTLETNPMVWPVQTALFAAFAAALAAAFIVPLVHLTKYSLNSFLISYIPLIPFISGYLIGVERERLAQRATCGLTGALACAAAGLGLLAIYWDNSREGVKLEETQALAFTTGAFLLLLLAGAFLLFGNGFIRAIAFPVALCGFMIPPPPAMLDPVVNLLQNVSAWAAHVFLLLARTPHIKDGTLLTLSDITIMVAPECSGFRAAIILFLTGLVGGHVFLRSGWNRLWLVLAVVPLAIARNGFRIFVLAELCAHLGPQMIDSRFHSRGGALLFALTLIPLLLFLVALRKSENRRHIKKSSPPSKIAYGRPLQQNESVS
jgi:exosortase C (VPDSG-CTERM-specific)